MKPCTNCARPGKLTICEDCAYRAESLLRPLVPWTTFQQAVMPKDDALHAEGFTEVWKNSRYQVWIRRPSSEYGELIHLSIKRNDRNPMHDWRDLHRIKNEILGKEEEAVELYPAESRLVDAANQYHLWCFKGQHAPFGYEHRAVMGPSNVPEFAKSKQRPFEQQPHDAMTEEEFTQKAAALRERGAARAAFSKRIRALLDAAARPCECEMAEDCPTTWPESAVQWCAACLARELRTLATEAGGLL
jgi:hypothetical protein